MKKILPEIELIDFSCEEEREKDAVLLFMKKYKRLFRYLFTKYANTAYSKKIVEFDALKEKSEIISTAEVTKMLKDHNVESNMLNRDELATLLRLVNARMGRNDINTLTFEGFQEFFLQTAIYIYSKPPTILSHLPLVESVRALIKHFEKATQGSTTLYTDPDTTALGDQDLIKELNKVVKTNPDYPVPEGYRKVTEKEAFFEFTLKPTVEKYVPEKSKICFSILDEIISKNIPGVHLIESVVKYEQRLKVYPDIVKPQKQNLPTRYMEAVEKKLKPKDLDFKRKESNQELPPVQPKKKILDEIYKIPGNMKLIIAGFPKEERENAKEIAFLVNEMIEAVEENRHDLSKKKLNRAIKERTQFDEESKKAEMEKEQKRKNRHQMLKKQIEDARKKEKEEEERKKKETEENKQKETEKLEKEKQDKIKAREELKKKIADAKLKKEEARKKLEEDEAAKKKDENEKKLKDREEFLKKKKEELVKLNFYKEIIGKTIQRTRRKKKKIKRRGREKRTLSTGKERKGKEKNGSSFIS